MEISFIQRLRIAGIFLALCTSYCAHSQTKDAYRPGNPVNIENTNADRKLDIHFNSDAVIENLLVIVSDSTGQTVFLDNQYRFKGIYARSIDLSGSPKGEYSVKVIRDDDKINKKIRMQ
jgi:hypothetical protein